MNRLRTNHQESHEATLAQLVSLQNLFTEAQTKLDHLASLAVIPPSPTESSPVEALPIEPASSIEAAPVTTSLTTTEERPRRRTLEEVRTIDDAWVLAKEKVEGNETVAAGIAGTVGGLVLAGLFSVLSR